MKRTEIVWQHYQQLSPLERDQFIDRLLQQQRGKLHELRRKMSPRPLTEADIQREIEQFYEDDETHDTGSAFPGGG